MDMFNRIGWLVGKFSVYKLVVFYNKVCIFYLTIIMIAFLPYNIIDLIYLGGLICHFK